VLEVVVMFREMLTTLKATKSATDCANAFLAQ
jgi:hypothetical protein